MNEIVDNILEKSAREAAEKFKTITVEKHIDLDLDLGVLLASDSNDLDLKLLRSNRQQKYLLNLSRDNTQILFNAIWELPTERVEETIVAKLPKPKFRLPREKCLPKARQLTKWEQFAKEKGIQKKSKSKLSWDDQLQVRFVLILVIFSG